MATTVAGAYAFAEENIETISLDKVYYARTRHVIVYVNSCSAASIGSIGKRFDLLVRPFSDIQTERNRSMKPRVNRVIENY